MYYEVITHGEVGVPFDNAFAELANCRFIVDDTELERTRDDPVPAVEIPEAAPEENKADAPQDPEEQKPKRKYTKHQGKSREQENIKQEILKAWNGDRSVSEICARTGYSRAMVTRYIPESHEG